MHSLSSYNRNGCNETFEELLLMGGFSRVQMDEREREREREVEREREREKERERFIDGMAGFIHGLRNCK